MFEDIKNLLSVAVWAPSGDNSQPWRFKLNGNNLKIYNLPDRDLPFFNFGQRGSLAAHGALIENIEIAAGHFGLKPEIKTFPDDSDLNFIAEIYFIKIDKSTHPLYEAIKMRCTNRKAYKKEKLPAEQVQAILNSANGFEGFKVIVTEDQGQKDEIGKASANMERIVLSDPQLHTPFFENVVWLEEEERKLKKGLYAKTMELPGPKFWIFKLASKWSRMKYLVKIGLPDLIAADNSKIYAAAGAFFAVVAPTGSSKDFFTTGRIMQRIWLQATKFGLNAHPVSGILFLVQRIFEKQTEWLTAGQIQLIENSYQVTKSALGVESGSVTFLLRVGKGPEPSGRCSRLDPVIEI